MEMDHGRATQHQGRRDGSLARNLADATGQSVTAAIEAALRDQMIRRDEVVLAWIAAIAPALKPPPRADATPADSGPAGRR
ncbi:type II toxin-antitoxin system VapB family antitoxin [Sphingomonas qilianensis]|uniref:Type II toxin-antitoxin system VapB family antitoxin n=1 Tax=Sphingomonas qilianensis TaxID=1736690 RepID=A0ABU9XPI5_9SPHN